MATLAHIFRHPIKSIGSEPLERVALTAGSALPWDRRWALTHGASKWDSAAPQWMRCGNFARVTFSPRLAQVRCALDEATGEVNLSHPDRPPLTARPDDPAGAAAVAEWAAPLVKAERPGPYQIVRAPNAAMTDVNEPWVSIKSLNSLEAVSQSSGLAPDPLRFRGNLWIDGLAPWAESDWIGREISVGPVRLRVAEPIGRCAATSANPETGQRDTDMVQRLREATGRTEFGLYAEVLTGGIVSVGDSVSAL